MTGEINKNYFCSAGFYEDGFCRGREHGCCKSVQECDSNCSAYHRKWPTPEQFKKEYGDKYTDDRPVWIYSDEKVVSPKDNDWICLPLGTAKFAKGLVPNTFIICACTPYPKPDKNWRP